MKSWDKLTHNEIDALSGNELSRAVWMAMGVHGYILPDDLVIYIAQDKTRSVWHSHEDANQALEVWGALLEIDDDFYLVMDSEDGINIYHRYSFPAIGSGTFCETIYRAYLKARQCERDDNVL